VLTPTGTTRLAAVIGHPVRHSLSPAIHNAAFVAAGLDWTYVAFDVEPGRGRAAIDALRALDIAGLSVTMPHKDDAFAAVDRRTPVAEALAAVNCVFRDGDQLVGDNTDGAGFVDGLTIDHGVDPAGLRCVVVGAGGAARAVIHALGEAGAAEVAVVNRTTSKAEVAAALAGGVGRVGSLADVGGADLVVNATSIGMGTPSPADVPVPIDALRPTQVVADLVVHPVRTPLLQAAETLGARTVDGRSMLVHQAAHAFRRWTGEEPSTTAMRRAVDVADGPPNA
jgi:shikimate dehydrogenase